MLAMEFGYRLAPPGDVTMLGHLLPIMLVAGCAGGWLADRPFFWPKPGERGLASPMTGLRPLTVLAPGLAVVALWADILANPGPQIG